MKRRILVHLIFSDGVGSGARGNFPWGPTLPTKGFGWDRFSLGIHFSSEEDWVGIDFSSKGVKIGPTRVFPSLDKSITIFIHTYIIIYAYYIYLLIFYLFF